MQEVVRPLLVQSCKIDNGLHIFFRALPGYVALTNKNRIDGDKALDNVAAADAAELGAFNAQPEDERGFFLSKCACAKVNTKAAARASKPSASPARQAPAAFAPLPDRDDVSRIRERIEAGREAFDESDDMPPLFAEDVLSFQPPCTPQDFEAFWAAAPADVRLFKLHRLLIQRSGVLESTAAACIATGMLLMLSPEARDQKLRELLAHEMEVAMSEQSGRSAAVQQNEQGGGDDGGHLKVVTGSHLDDLLGQKCYGCADMSRVLVAVYHGAPGCVARAHLQRLCFGSL